MANYRREDEVVRSYLCSHPFPKQAQWVLRSCGRGIWILTNMVLLRVAFWLRVQEYAAVKGLVDDVSLLPLDEFPAETIQELWIAVHKTYGKYCEFIGKEDLISGLDDRLEQLVNELE